MELNFYTGVIGNHDVAWIRGLFPDSQGILGQNFSWLRVLTVSTITEAKFLAALIGVREVTTKPSSHLSLRIMQFALLDVQRVDHLLHERLSHG